MRGKEIAGMLREQFGRECITVAEAASVMDATTAEAWAWTVQRVNPLPCLLRVDAGECRTARCVPVDAFSLWLSKGGEMTMGKEEITFGVRGYDAKHRLVVWEYLGKYPVNEYTGYIQGDLIKLYPRRGLEPSGLKMEKQTVCVRDTRREF